MTVASQASTSDKGAHYADALVERLDAGFVFVTADFLAEVGLALALVADLVAAVLAAACGSSSQNLDTQSPISSPSSRRSSSWWSSL
jgi:hypothetical protein